MEESRKTILTRTYFIYLTMMILGFAIIGKAAHIQFVEGSEWREKAQRLTLKYEAVEPVRGSIYSSDGKLLAVSVPVYEIRMDVASNHISDGFFMQNVDSLALCLANLFGDRSKIEHKKRLLQARAAANRYFLIKRNVSYAQLKELKTFPIFRLGKFRGGLIVLEQTKREFPYKNLAYRTIGWDKEGSINDVGLEGAYSEVLSGTSGKRLLQRIGNGVWRPLNERYEIEPRNGQNIVTTINTLIQDVAHDALLKQMQAHRAEQGCVVLMEVETGHVSAIVNLLRTEHDNYEEYYNYAIAHSSEPGSTFKLAAMLAAFEDKAVELNDSIDTGTGTTFYYNRRMQDSEKEGYGTITAQHAFEVSSNVGISKIIYEYYKDKPQQFIKRLNDMSLAEPLHLEIPGEGRSFIKNTDDPSWSGISLPWMSIGYELTMTPLQTLVFYNAVANNGRMVKPLFVREITEAGRTIKRFDPIVINASIASKQSIGKAQQLLLGVVENGTIRHLNNSDYKIAGKTGTAQIASGTSGYNKSDYKASFVGYFPADNPKYSMIVVVSNPRKGIYYGAQIAAPVFREIADKVYSSNLDLQRDESPVQDYTGNPWLISGKRKDLLTTFKELNYPVINQGESDWATLRIDSDTASIHNRDVGYEMIPSVVGMSARDAVYILEKLGMRVNINGIGTVKRQSILPGASQKYFDEITLYLSI